MELVFAIAHVPLVPGSGALGAGHPAPEANAVVFNEPLAPPSQRKAETPETAPPLVKALTSRMSPSWWEPVKSTAPSFELQPTSESWRNHTPMFASPLFDNRSSPK